MNIECNYNVMMSEMIILNEQWIDHNYTRLWFSYEVNFEYKAPNMYIKYYKGHLVYILIYPFMTYVHILSCLSFRVNLEDLVKFNLNWLSINLSTMYSTYPGSHDLLWSRLLMTLILLNFFKLFILAISIIWQVHNS